MIVIFSRIVLNVLPYVLLLNFWRSYCTIFRMKTRKFLGSSLSIQILLASSVRALLYIDFSGPVIRHVVGVIGQSFQWQMAVAFRLRT